ncbi:hypothetical protein KUCAC02_006706 [Chaenocephalus aceratus]|uniref:Uncharacterized protein n=1 Tax=Chaenocephalus aceratus TaxID=36190 RepID=A0ACB9VSH4_CHAAC|nr:hypothetical protein KUCAC02_006706 [Chaenocephalus aceratus]
MSSLKHMEQLEKSRNAQLMDDAKKREDNLNQSSQQIKDSLRQKEERIEELEEALRESVQITAEREVVLAQEEHSRTHSEKQDSSKAHRGAAEGGSEGKGLMDSTSDQRECVCRSPGGRRRNEGMEMGTVPRSLDWFDKWEKAACVEGMKAALRTQTL